MWVIHGRFQNVVTVPLIYALLPAKTATIYTRALALILQKIDLVNPGARPKTIVIDFEIAEVNAFRQLMGPSVKIHGCFFHFKQALWRKVQDLGLAARYKDEYEEGFHQHVKMFCALTFCDPAHIKHLFDQLAEVFVDLYDRDDAGNQIPNGPCYQLTDYFERTWVGRQRLEPRFSLEMWNNKNVTLEGDPRTTNAAESWHNVFSKAFHSHHPNPYKLIDALLQEQVSADIKCVRALAGQVPPMFSTGKYRRANDALLTVLRGYDNDMNNDPTQFLLKCCNYIQY